jgi:hypothetical protein
MASGRSDGLIRPAGVPALAGVLALACCSALAALSSLHASAPPDVDAAFAKFWAAKDPGAAGKAIDDVLRSGATFDAAYERLKRGRPYQAAVATGVVTGRRAGIEGEFAYTSTCPRATTPRGGSASASSCTEASIALRRRSPGEEASGGSPGPSRST